MIWPEGVLFFRRKIYGGEWGRTFIWYFWKCANYNYYPITLMDQREDYFRSPTTKNLERFPCFIQISIQECRGLEGMKTQSKVKICSAFSKEPFQAHFLPFLLCCKWHLWDHLTQLSSRFIQLASLFIKKSFLKHLICKNPNWRPLKEKAQNWIPNRPLLGGAITWGCKDLPVEFILAKIQSVAFELYPSSLIKSFRITKLLVTRRWLKKS